MIALTSTLKADANMQEYISCFLYVLLKRGFQVFS